MMNIITQTTNLSLTPAIEEYLAKKLVALERFIDPNDTGAQADVELEKTTGHHQSGKIFRAEINLHVAHGDFRAEETAEDLYSAIDLMKDEIVRVVTEHKDKYRTHARKGAQEVKELLRDVS